MSDGTPDLPLRHVATIKDVAELAGVSEATVSRVVSGSRPVRPESAEKVRLAVERTDFRPSRRARGLRTRESKVWGLLIADIQNPFFTGMVRGVEDVANRAGYSLILCNSDEDLEKEAHYLDVLIAEQVGGVFITPSDEDETSISAAVRANVPVVTVDRRLSGIDVDSVLVDNARAAREAVHHLVDNGAERVAVVTGEARTTTARERVEGARSALEQRGLRLPPERIVTASTTGRGAYEATLELLRRRPRPDAIFATNNQVAAGALRAIAAAGISMPDDLLFIGFDELPLAELIGTGVSAVAQPTYEMGVRAANLLLSRLNGNGRPPQAVLLSGTLQVRGSSVRQLASADGRRKRGQ